MGMQQQPCCCGKTLYVDQRYKLRGFSGRESDLVWDAGGINEVHGLDIQNKYIYGHDSTGIFRFDETDPTARTYLVSRTGLLGIFYSRANEKLIWLQRATDFPNPSTDSIRSCDLDGSNEQVIFSRTFDTATIGGITQRQWLFNPDNDRIYYSFFDFPLSPYYEYSYVDLAGGSPVKISEGSVYNLLAVDARRQTIIHVTPTNQDLEEFPYDSDVSSPRLTAADFGANHKLGGWFSSTYHHSAVEYNPTNGRIYFSVFNNAGSFPHSDTTGIWSQSAGGGAVRLEYSSEKIYNPVYSDSRSSQAFRLGKGFVNARDVL